MLEIPPALGRLVADGRLPMSQVSAGLKRQLSPLLEGGILQQRLSGSGEVLTVTQDREFRAWLSKNYPAFDGGVAIPEGAQRAAAVALRRDSKATGDGVSRSIISMRAWEPGTNTVRIDGKPLEVTALTRTHNVAASVISNVTVLDLGRAQAMLVENLECFLAAETLGTAATLALYSGGRVSERLITCLARSQLGQTPLLHLPDYDPVGLDDYLRLKQQLGERVRLFVPSDLEQRFERFSATSLITEKRRNRELLEKFMAERPKPADWPCAESAQVFQLIRHHGAGLEQESLFIGSGGGSAPLC